MLVLGIETSCDETAAAVVRDGRQVLANVVLSQVAQHQPFGGIVPEIACRAHVETLPAIVDRAMAEASVKWEELDAIAVTHGPGLAGALLVGLSFAQGASLQSGKPLYGVNHVEAHLYSLFLDPTVPEPEAVCPILALMVSGGHTLLVYIERWGRYRILGQTLDDAAGEALDKGAAVLRLGYPGGPVIEARARDGDPNFHRFPRGLERFDESTRTFGLDPRYCFSFSGLKTALLYYVRSHPEIFEDPTLFRNIVASYQEAVFDTLVSRVSNALQDFRVNNLACVGGVAKNAVLRRKLEDLAGKIGVGLLLAPLNFCTDNAAMVAGLAARPDAALWRDATTLDVCPDLRLGTLPSSS